MAEVSSNLTELTVDLLSSYLGHNNVRAEEIPNLIQSTHAALKALEEAPAAEIAEEAKSDYTPAVTARKSLSNPAHIISMIDGKPYTMLKRHLAKNGLTPAEYRQRYKLPADYPMTARNYSERRKELAHRIGLGQKGRGEGATTPASEPAPKSASAGKPRKARAKKVVETADA